MSGRNRREFIQVAGAGTVGLAISSPAYSQGRILGANDRVRVGLVGFSDRSRGDLIPAFMKHAKELNFDIVAVSDIWTPPARGGRRLRREASPARTPALAATTTSSTTARTSTPSSSRPPTSSTRCTASKP